MKCYNSTDTYEMGKVLTDMLQEIRKQRGFNVKDYIHDKIYVLNKYMKKCELNACIIAISGGIDSAVVLALANKAAKIPGSPIKKIIPVSLPCLNNVGVINQEDATTRGNDICKKIDTDQMVLEMSEMVDAIRRPTEELLHMDPDDWALGQLVPYCRTPILYYIATLLNTNGYKPIILGTTNFSEGGYLGYVGKASDGMVDLQMISDIYKSEVYAVAKDLNVPKSIMDITPSGDMYDGRKDEEVFGASYDFVELYQELLRMKDIDNRYKYLSLLYENENSKIWAYNLENLHNYNAHKYLAGSPAVHLDLYDTNVPGGWHNRSVVERLNLLEGNK